MIFVYIIGFIVAVWAFSEPDKKQLCKDLQKENEELKTANAALRIDVKSLSEELQRRGWVKNNLEPIKFCGKTTKELLELFRKSGEVNWLKFLDKNDLELSLSHFKFTAFSYSYAFLYSISFEI